MPKDQAYLEAEKKIEKALKSGETTLDLSSMEITELPELLELLTQLQSLNLSHNKLIALPESVGQLRQLHELILTKNRLKTLPKSLTKLNKLQVLELWRNPLSELPKDLALILNLEMLSFNSPILSTLPKEIFKLTKLKWLDLSGYENLIELPKSIGELTQLERLVLTHSKVAQLPDVFDRLTHLRVLTLRNNQLNDIPPSIAHLKNLEMLDLDGNPLNPELGEAYKQGYLNGVKAYLRAKAEAQITLNEAKLILVGEGEVGKTCLMDALLGNEWQEHLSTHGIEIQQLKVSDPDTETEFTLNTWDFGGQRVYRPTHQLFFSSPAVYLVVWKPREGPQQGFIKEWIQLVKRREPSAKILVVATHGGPQQRQPDIDRQELWVLILRGIVTT